MADILKKHNVQFDQGGLLWTMNLHRAGIDEVVKNRMADTVINQTQLVFLERGNANAGLLHAYQRHGADFASMCGIHRYGNSDLERKNMDTLFINFKYK